MMINLRTVLYAVGILIVLAVAFQLFGRYSYTYYKGVAVERIDRLTATACRMPCLSPAATNPPSAVAFAIPPTGEEANREEKAALELVLKRADAQGLETAFRGKSLDWDATTDYEWVQGLQPNPGFCPHVVYVNFETGNPFDTPAPARYTWTVDLERKTVAPKPQGDDPDSVSTMVGTVTIKVPRLCPDGSQRSQ